MIPKTIHYCWFGGGPFGALHQRCIDSWKKHCPEYEFRLWNEHNSDIDNDYCREALIQKKWAFISDWVRFDVLSKHGGIYLDTDIELIRSLDAVRDYPGCVAARESREVIGSAFIGCRANDPIMLAARRLMLEDLPRQRLFATSPVILKHAIGLNDPSLSTVLNPETFFPFNPYDTERPHNPRQLMFSDITPATIGIHQYRPTVSWVDSRFRRFIFKMRKAVALQPRWDISFTPFQQPTR